MSETTQPNPDVTQDVAQKYDSELASPPIQREVASVSPGELKAGAAERAQQRPLLQKIIAAFKKEKGSYRELIINSEPLEKRVALLVDGRLEKYEIERESDDRMVGGIYKGRIKNLDPGLKAAFVDIGYAKNALWRALCRRYPCSSLSAGRFLWETRRVDRGLCRCCGPFRKAPHRRNRRHRPRLALQVAAFGTRGCARPGPPAEPPSGPRLSFFTTCAVAQHSSARARRPPLPPWTSCRLQRSPSFAARAGR